MADIARAVAAIDIQAGADRGFGRAIHVRDLHAAGQVMVERFLRGRLTAGREIAHRSRKFRQGAKQRRRQEAGLDAPGRHLFAQLRRIPPLRFARDEQPVTIVQSHEHFEDVRVKRQRRELQAVERIRLIAQQTLRVAPHHIGRAPVLAQRAFWPPGSAGGVNHVGQLPGVHTRQGCGIRVGERFICRQAKTAWRQSLRRSLQRVFGQDDRAVDLLQDIIQPLCRRGGIQRHIGTARLHDGQHRHHRLRAALQIQRDQRLRRHGHAAQPLILRPQPQRQTIAALRQLAVAERSFGIGHGDAIRVTARLSGHALEQRRFRIGRCRPALPAVAAA